MILITRISKFLETTTKPTRTLIIPQAIITQQMEQYFHITSQNYDFLTKSDPHCSQIYTLCSDTPSGLLSKPGIHIFPESVPQQTAQQKFKAFTKKLQSQYQKSFSKCKTPAEIFHMDRRIRTDIRQRCRFIGRVLGKYKHYNLFKSIHDINRDRTLEEYRKNGVSVAMLGKLRIFPSGPVWLPTTDHYLKLLEQFLLQYNKVPAEILDLGCGSGVLSFILARHFKNAKIYAVDSNKFAVETTEVNASSFGLNKISAITCDITNPQQLSLCLQQAHSPQKYDLIISNPPWLIGKRSQHQSPILDGVYDNKQKFLKSTFQIAKKYLKNNGSRFILIYSDLSINLGIQQKTVEEYCKQEALLVHGKLEAHYPKALENQSVLAKFKLMSKVQLYQLGLS